MRSLTFLAAAVALVAGCATQPNTITSSNKPSGREQALVEQRAVVAGVDQKRRLLELEGSSGDHVVLPVDEEFRDFDQLRVGDTVVVSLTEAIAWQVKPAATGAPGVSASETLINPKPGEAPGGSIERAIRITATVGAVDIGAGTVTLTGVQGRSQTLKVKDAADLQRVSVGDLVDITYTEVRALSVRPADKTQTP